MFKFFKHRKPDRIPQTPSPALLCSSLRWAKDGRSGLGEDGGWVGLGGTFSRTLSQAIADNIKPLDNCVQMRLQCGQFLVGVVYLSNPDKVAKEEGCDEEETKGLPESDRSQTKNLRHRDVPEPAEDDYR